MALSNLHTPAVLMLISHIIGCCGWSRCWGADPPSLVKTLWNWSRRISAFSLLLQPVNHSVSGDYSNVVFFLLLVYFQKGFELFVWSPFVMVLLIYSHSALRIPPLHVFWIWMNFQFVQLFVSLAFL